MLLTKEEFIEEVCRIDRKYGWADKLINHNEALTAESVELKAQLRAKDEELKDKEIAFECVKAMLKTYMDFVEALDPNAKAYEKAMQKMKKK